MVNIERAVLQNVLQTWSLAGAGPAPARSPPGSVPRARRIATARSGRRRRTARAAAAHDTRPSWRVNRRQASQHRRQVTGPLTVLGGDLGLPSAGAPRRPDQLAQSRIHSFVSSRDRERPGRRRCRHFFAFGRGPWGDFDAAHGESLLVWRGRLLPRNRGGRSGAGRSRGGRSRGGQHGAAKHGRLSPGSRTSATVPPPGGSAARPSRAGVPQSGGPGRARGGGRMVPRSPDRPCSSARRPAPCAPGHPGRAVADPEGDRPGIRVGGQLHVAVRRRVLVRMVASFRSGSWAANPGPRTPSALGGSRRAQPAPHVARSSSTACRNARSGRNGPGSEPPTSPSSLVARAAVDQRPAHPARAPITRTARAGRTSPTIPVIGQRCRQ